MEELMDAVKVAPDAYRVLLENDKVRVLELRIKPGEKIPMHSHRYSMVAYSFGATTHKWTLPDGKTRDMHLKAGEIVWSGPFAHGAENTGKTDVHLLIVEIK
jgi:quercetin dioxygenase-like cupin family protein